MKTKALRFWIVQLMSLATLLLFLSLGTWQLNRGNVKNIIEEANNAQQQESFVDVQLPLEDLPSWRYKKIKLFGVYDDKQFLLDNQVRDRITGYNVLTPLYIPNQKHWVLVDRGWIPQGKSRSELPDIDLEEKNNIAVSGSVYVPYDKSYSLGGIADGEDNGWPRRIQFVDYQQVGDRLGVNLLPFTLRLNANDKHGYRRDWTENHISSQKHYGYAFQWYAMALAIIVLWWIYSIKPLLIKK